MIRLDIMDGVDGGCAVGGGPGFVGIPPYLVRQAQVPFPGEVKNCANLRNSRIRNCPHCRLHPGDRSCRAREEARKGVAVLHREVRRIARNVAEIPEPFCDGSVGYFALEAPSWQEAGEVTGRALGSRQFHVGPLASADCSAGIPDGDALYLVRSRFQSLRGGVNDVGFHPLPIGDAARFLKPGHRLVVAPPGRVKPEFQRPSLRCCRIDPYPPGSRFGSGGVRAVGN